MSRWQELDMRNKVLEVLDSVPLRNPQGHNFRRPFLTAYQIAIDIERRFPEVLDQLGLEIGGVGTGSDSLARYVARQLAGEIDRHDETFEIEGAFVSNRDVVDFRFRAADGSDIVSSSSNSSIDLTMFRRRVLG